MKTLSRYPIIAGIALMAASFAGNALAHDRHDGDHWKRDRHELRWQNDSRDDRHDRGHRHGHRFGHRHVDERVVFIREPQPVYIAPPAPVIYRSGRPVITISTPDIIIPF